MDAPLARWGAFARIERIDARIEIVKNLGEEGVLSPGTVAAILTVLERLDENQTVGMKDIRNLLGC